MASFFTRQFHSQPSFQHWNELCDASRSLMEPFQENCQEQVSAAMAAAAAAAVEEPSQSLSTATLVHCCPKQPILPDKTYLGC